MARKEGRKKNMSVGISVGRENEKRLMKNQGSQSTQREDCHSKLKAETYAALR
jgi:hypothetical protein